MDPSYILYHIIGGKLSALPEVLLLIIGVLYMYRRSFIAELSTIRSRVVLHEMKYECSKSYKIFQSLLKDINYALKEYNITNANIYNIFGFKEKQDYRLWTDGLMCVKDYISRKDIESARCKYKELINISDICENRYSCSPNFSCIYRDLDKVLDLALKLDPKGLC
jgi:hypothetical protein